MPRSRLNRGEDGGETRGGGDGQQPQQQWRRVKKRGHRSLVATMRTSGLASSLSRPSPLFFLDSHNGHKGRRRWHAAATGAVAGRAAVAQVPRHARDENKNHNHACRPPPAQHATRPPRADHRSTATRRRQRWRSSRAAPRRPPTVPPPLTRRRCHRRPACVVHGVRGSPTEPPPVNGVGGGGGAAHCTVTPR